MNKKLMKIIAIITLLLTSTISLTGCGNKSNETKNNSNKSGEKENSALVIGDNSVDLNKSGSFKNITYKYPEKAQASNVGNYSIIDLMNGEDLVVRIGMCFFENKTIGEAIEGASLSSVDVIDCTNSTWNVYEGKDNDKYMMVYATQEGDDTYTITFISYDKIDDFSNEFMKEVVFNK